MEPKYPWAANAIKLQQAENFLLAKKKTDPSVEVSEETIKAEYVKRAGLVIDASRLEHEEEAASRPARRAARKAATEDKEVDEGIKVSEADPDDL